MFFSKGASSIRLLDQTSERWECSGFRKSLRPERVGPERQSGEEGLERSQVTASTSAYLVCRTRTHVRLVLSHLLSPWRMKENMALTSFSYSFSVLEVGAVKDSLSPCYRSHCIEGEGGIA